MRKITVLTTISCGILALLLLTTAAPGSVAAQSGYELSTADSVDTPTREVTLRGATYDISALGRAETGGSVDLSVNTPQDDQFYRVYLYNSSQTPVIRESGTGDDTITFNLDDQDPGTYMFALQEQGTTRVIHPLVIKGYDVDLETPEQVPAGDSFTADISLTETVSDVTANRVEVVVAGQNSQLTETANQDDNSYTATVSTDPLSDGSYLVYANVRGSNTVYNEQEILGASSTNTIAVGGDESTEDEPTEDEPTEDEPTEDEPTENESTEDEPTENESMDGSIEPSGQIEDPEEREELPEPDENDQSASETEQTESESSSESSSSIPGFTPEIAVIAVLLVTLITQIQARNR